MDISLGLPQDLAQALHVGSRLPTICTIRALTLGLCNTAYGEHLTTKLDPPQAPCFHWLPRRENAPTFNSPSPLP